MAEQYDAIIVGGGIGGSALGTVLARAGKSALVLERQTTFRDRVRGEWIAPWGVMETKRTGLYDVLVAAGGHHVTHHMRAGDTVDPQAATANLLDLTAFVPGSGGPLCIGHPGQCEALWQSAVAAGAECVRPLEDVRVVTGSKPSVVYKHDGSERTATARVIVGADGRMSAVRQAAGMELHRDPTHHLFGGMLIEGADAWPAEREAIGTEGDVNYFIFPQGKGRARLYIAFSKEDPTRFTGDGGPQRFLREFELDTLAGADAITSAQPAGPVAAFGNEDSWTDEPYAEGCVLVGDAAGWNDPIIGQGLSITHRDVRIVSEIMLGGEDWSPAAFAPYGEERRERMRRLRFSASITAKLDAEFGDEAKALRTRVSERQDSDPSLQGTELAAIIGPDALPAEFFEESMRERLFAE